MVVTFVLSSLFLSGGVRDIVEIANRLAKDHHKIFFVVPDKTVDNEVLEEMSPDIQVRITSLTGVGKLTLFHMVRLAFQLALLVPESDFIISTQSPTTVSTLVAAKILGRGIPLWFYQDYIEMFHDRPIIAWLVRNALRWHNKAIVLSNYSKEELESYVHGKQVVVSRVGLSHTEFLHPNIEREKDKPGKNILYLGDMRPRKGWDDFWTAMDYVYRERSDIEVLLVSKEKCTIPASVPCQYFFRPSRKEIAHLMASCDVFVSASWWESFGIPPLEAMACGAPVVMTDSRGSREYAVNMENCLLVHAQEPLELARAVLRIFDDYDLEIKLRQNGPNTAAEFSWEKSYQIFLETIKSEIVKA